MIARMRGRSATTNRLAWAVSACVLALSCVRTARFEAPPPRAQCSEGVSCGRFVRPPPGIQPEEPPEEISCCQVDDRVVWTIHNPDIRKFSTEYSMIRFAPGDEV